MTVYNPKQLCADNPPLVIIGTGLAGYHTAKQWRLIDKETPLVLITEDDGAFYSKPQLSTVLARGKTPDDLIVKTAQQMAAELDATIHTQTTVKAIVKEDRSITLQDQTTLPYRDCVLATGAKVHQLKLDPNITTALFAINSLTDYRALHEALMAKPAAKVVIIGAGLVGSELSNDLVQAGYDVSVVAIDPWPMARLLPEALGHTVQKQFAAHGVQWYLNTSVTHIDKAADGVFSLHCDDSNKTVLKADIIISAIGFRPNHALAEQAGLTIHHGIVVNDRMQSSDPHIYALGDCAELEQSWQPYIAPILHAGKILAQVLAGDRDARVDYPVMPVIAKTPFCKVQGVFDAAHIMQAYRCELDEAHTRALYYDADVLKAFALCGDAVSERAQWQAQLDPDGTQDKPQNPTHQRRIGDS